MTESEIVESDVTTRKIMVLDGWLIEKYPLVKH